MLSPRRAWLLCTLLFCASALSFLDRQVLSVLAPKITAEFALSNTVYSRIVFAFVLSYTVMFAWGGKLLDAVGTRRGLGWAVGLWSLACGAHAFVTGPWSLGAARFLLGVGEGPCFPGTTKGAVEWMDPARRGLAVSFANSGSALGAILAPPLTVWVAGSVGWRGAFAATGALGLLWLFAWWWAFRGADTEPALSADAAARPPSPTASLRSTTAIASTWRAEPWAQTDGARAASAAAASAPVRWRDLLARPAVRRLLVARFCFDPVFYFYMFWIPQYLSRERGMSLAAIGGWLWIPFVALQISNVGAGWLSDRLVAGGWERHRARLTVMLVAAALTPASFGASLAGTPGLAIALMAVLLFAHGLWIGNYMTLVGETVAAREVATTVGLTGFVGGIAGMTANLVIGPVVDGLGFAPIFCASAGLYPLAWLVLSSAPAQGKPGPAPAAG